MAIGQPPFMGKSEEELFLGIMKKRILYPTWITAECKGIIERLCTKEVRANASSGSWNPVQKVLT